MAPSMRRRCSSLASASVGLSLRRPTAAVSVLDDALTSLAALGRSRLSVSSCEDKRDKGAIERRAKGGEGTGQEGRRRGRREAREGGEGEGRRGNGTGGD